MTDRDDVRQASFEHVSTVLHPTSPVKWTPEDAATFISSAIAEAQKPTLTALRRRGVSAFVFVLTLLVLVSIIAGMGYYFAYYREAQWVEREHRLVDERDASNKKYETYLSETTGHAVRVTNEVIDRAQLRQELEAARKQGASALAEGERLAAQAKELTAANKRLESERDMAKGDLAKLKETLTRSEADIANVEKIKSTHQQEVEKLRKHVELLKLAGEQQKSEITLLRERLTTMQNMVGNLSGDEAASGKPTEAKAVEAKPAAPVADK